MSSTHTVQGYHEASSGALTHRDVCPQVDRHVGEALEAMKELEKHISVKKENKAKVL